MMYAKKVAAHDVQGLDMNCAPLGLKVCVVQASAQKAHVAEIFLHGRDLQHHNLLAEGEPGVGIRVNRTGVRQHWIHIELCNEGLCEMNAHYNTHVQTWRLREALS
jgi:hypothetical protein